MRKWSKRAFLSIALSLLLLPAFVLPSHASYQCLRTTGAGYASILDANQKGLNMGLSDFMMCARVKTSYSAGNQFIVYKAATNLYYLRINEITGYLKGRIYDGANDGVVLASNLPVTDGKWHHVCFVVDKSIVTGLKLFVDGVETTYSEQVDPTGVGNIDNAGDIQVGLFVRGSLDELRIFNFGYGGLPEDYEAYITWLSQDRNWFKDISSYNDGAWNCYADADRTEKVTDGGLENWTDDMLDDWTEGGESVGVREITKETTEIHGGSAAAKLEATNNDGTGFNISENITLTANKYYSGSCWVYFPTKTAGWAFVYDYNTPDGNTAIALLTATNVAYTYYERVFSPSTANNILFVRLLDETTTGIVYFDDISIKRTGLVARWRFNGDYTDETSNSNTFVEEGTGNAFPGYTLKKQKIISPYSLN